MKFKSAFYICMQSVSLKCSCIYCLKVLNFTLVEYLLQKLVVIHRIYKYFEVFLYKLSLSLSQSSFHLNIPKLLMIFHEKSEVFKGIQTWSSKRLQEHTMEINSALTNKCKKFWSKNILSEIEGKVFSHNSSLT